MYNHLWDRATPTPDRLPPPRRPHIPRWHHPLGINAWAQSPAQSRVRPGGEARSLRSPTASRWWGPERAIDHPGPQFSWLYCKEDVYSVRVTVWISELVDVNLFSASDTSGLVPFSTLTAHPAARKLQRGGCRHALHRPQCYCFLLCLPSPKPEDWARATSAALLMVQAS